MSAVLSAGFVLITGLAGLPSSGMQAGPPAAPPPVVTPVSPAPAPVSPGQATQPMPEPAGSSVESRPQPHPVKARYLVQVMEGVLERAVRYAAGQMNRKLQSVSPDLLQLSGAARARGFRLDGYGVFFDVEVPAALRQTMGWTARMMQPNDQTLDQAIVQLRRVMGELEGKRRLDAETALKLVELRARPAAMPRQIYSPSMLNSTVSATSGEAAPVATGGDPAVVSGGPSANANSAQGVPAPPPPSPADLAWMQNPDVAYEMEVRDALIGAMLGYGSTLALRPDEWLTVAARDNQTVVVPGDLSETVTVILRIKGSDLAELVAGRLTEESARRRVEVREF